MSVIVAFIFKYHRFRRSFYKNIDKYICLNDQQIKLLKKTGYSEGKIVKKYNFVADGAVQSSRDLKEYSLPPRFAGLLWENRRRKRYPSSSGGLGKSSRHSISCHGRRDPWKKNSQIGKKIEKIFITWAMFPMKNVWQ